MQMFEGTYDGTGRRFGLVVSRFNQTITDRLLDGALDCLKRHGVSTDDIAVAKVPGAFELPLIAQKMAQTGKYDAILCIGAVIRGATSHFDYVCAQAASGIAQTSLKCGIPVLFSVLTTDTIEQAEERAGTKLGNLGFTYALSALEMADLIAKIPESDHQKVLSEALARDP